MVKVKICGITNIEDALGSLDAGSDGLGFVFYRRSPRYISPQGAADIIRCLPENILKFGVFVNSKAEEIKQIAQSSGINVLQFHGDETSIFCKMFDSYRIVKAFRINNDLEINRIADYDVFGYLFDTLVTDKPGGTGQIFDWNLLKCLKEKIKCELFLSGGLNENNISMALSIVRPDWVDVSSSVELKPGKKDIKKIKRFISAAKRANL